MIKPGDGNPFDVWNPETWKDSEPDTPPAPEVKVGPDTTIQVPSGPITSFNALVNHIRRRNRFFGEIGVNEVVALTHEIGEHCKATQSNLAYETGMDEVRRAVSEVMNIGKEAFNRRFQAYILDIEKEIESRKEQGLLLTGAGKVKPNTYNAKRILSQQPSYAKRFIYNEFNITIEDRATGKPLEHIEVSRITTFLQQLGNYDFTANVVYDAINELARDNSYHPLLEYLNSLHWDGTDRLSKAGANYWGTKQPIEDVFIHKFLISAVARVIEPGCKVDTFPVFEGPQGARKSTALRILAGDRYFIDHLPDLTNKDVYMQMAGMWIIEMAELDVLSRAETSKIKAFSSTQTDKFRPPYERAPRTVPRSSVLAGTVNKTEYLTDETGNRRVWPILVGTISTPALITDRDQIWAQAVQEYKAGQIWWLTPQEEALHAPIAKSKLETGVTDELLQQWLDGYRYIMGAGMVLDESLTPRGTVVSPRAGVARDKFTVTEAASGIGWESNRITRAQEMALGRSLKKFGYMSKAVWDSKTGKTVRRWSKD